MTAAWLRPTVRSIRWTALSLTPITAIGLFVALRLGSPVAPAGPVVALLLAAVVAAGVYATGDVAGELLDPLPTGARHRLARRTLVVAVPAGAALVATTASGRELFGAGWSAPGASGIAALGLCAAAAAVVAARHPDAPAMTVAGWGLLGFVLTLLGAPCGVAFPWWI